MIDTDIGDQQAATPDRAVNATELGDITKGNLQLAADRVFTEKTGQVRQEEVAWGSDESAITTDVVSCHITTGEGYISKDGQAVAGETDLTLYRPEAADTSHRLAIRYDTGDGDYYLYAQDQMSIWDRRFISSKLDLGEALALLAEEGDRATAERSEDIDDDVAALAERLNQAI